MAIDEQRFLSHLIESLKTDDSEALQFQKIRIREENQEQVLREIKELSKEDKRYVFDTCMDALLSDRELSHVELKFLHTLRKTCCVSYFAYNRQINDLLKTTKSKISHRPIIIFSVLSLILLIGLTIFKDDSNEIEVRDSVKIRTPKKPQIECTKHHFTFSYAGSSGRSKGESKEIYNRAKSALVTVLIYQSGEVITSGSGSVISRDSLGTFYVVTNRHVLVNPETNNDISVEVKLVSGARFDAKIDFYSEEHDIAFLAVKGLDQFCSIMKLRKRSDLNVGEPVFALGSPLGLENTFTSGMISALRESYIQTDATISSGSSGGPLLDARGAQCGVVTLGHRSHNFNFALYTDVITDVYKEREEYISSRKPDGEIRKSLM